MERYSLPSHCHCQRQRYPRNRIIGEKKTVQRIPVAMFAIPKTPHTHGTPNRPAVANCLRDSDTQPYSQLGRQTSASSSSLLLRLSIRRAASRLASIQTRRRRRRGTKDADLMPLAVLMRWLQLRFDFDSTAVRLLIKGHEGHSDVTSHSQSR